MNHSAQSPLSATKKVYVLLVLLLTSISGVVYAQSSGSDQIIPELVFQNPVLVAGVAGQDGATYLFANVAAGIDAKVKISSRSAANVTLTSIDLNNFGWSKAFQPQLGIAGNVAANQNWWMEFELNFVKAGTNDAKKIKGFKVTSIDVDGDGVSIREYVQMDRIKSVEYCPITHLREGTPIANNSNDGDDDDDDANEMTKLIQGPVLNALNIDTAATTVMATFTYEDKDMITFKLGATSGTIVSNAGERMSSLWFKAFSMARPLVILPVRMSSFSASLEKGTVTVNWSTESEVNFSHFVLERSTDGKQWKDIATIFAMGAGATQTVYAYKDKEVISSTGIAYYRIRLIEDSKEASYTSVKVIRLGKEEGKGVSLTSYPNPVQDLLHVTMPAGWQNKALMIEMYNSNGVRVKSSKVTTAGQTENVSMAGMAKGFYLVKVTCSNESAQQAIVKN